MPGYPFLFNLFLSARVADFPETFQDLTHKLFIFLSIHPIYPANGKISDMYG